MMEQVIYRPIRELSELISNKELSPVELVNTFLDRLERLGPRYNAVVSLTRDRAIKQAQKAEMQEQQQAQMMGDVVKGAAPQVAKGMSEQMAQNPEMMEQMQQAMAGQA